MKETTGTPAMKVMTFNLRVMVESDGANAWDRRCTAAAQAILHHQADIVCTQEGRYSMLQELEAALRGRYAWIGEGRRGGREDEHCAIFYNKEQWRVMDFGSFGLSESPERLGVLDWGTDYPRMCTWGRFLSQDGAREIDVFNTHLDHISEEAQIKGMALIRERIESGRTNCKRPVILTGDFNVEPNHAVVQGLERAGYRNAYQVLPGGTSGVGKTFHDFQGGEAGEPIDYIFTSPEVLIRKIEVDRRLYDGRYPSDHYPVCAVVSIASIEEREGECV